MIARLLPLLLAVVAWPAAAQDVRDLCPSRPGLGTPPCIVDKGHVLAEVALGDWKREDDGARRTDTILTGDMLLRYGIDTNSEVQIGWTAYGHVRDRDASIPSINRSSGVGDVLLAYKRSLRNPDGSGLSIAEQGFVTLPTGGSTIGAGDWSAGVVVPVSMDVVEGVSLQFSPEVDASVDEDGKGRHVAYGCVVRLGFDLSDTLGFIVETSAFRDDDPDAHSTEVLFAASLGWQPAHAWQLDVGSNLGLNADSPDAQVYLGVSRRF